MLVIDNKKILLIPKDFTVGYYGPSTLYNYEFLPKAIYKDIIKGESTLILRRKNGKPYITKKAKNNELRKKGFIPSKHEMVLFARDNPGITKQLRKTLQERRNKKTKN